MLFFFPGWPTIKCNNNFRPFSVEFQSLNNKKFVVYGGRQGRAGEQWFLADMTQTARQPGGQMARQPEYHFTASCVVISSVVDDN